MKDEEVRKAVYLERVKSHLADIIDIKEVDQWLKENVFNVDIASLTPKQLRKLYDTVQIKVAEIYDRQTQEVKAKLDELFEDTYQREVKTVQPYTEKNIAVPENISTFSAAVFIKPLDFSGLKGVTIEDIFSGFSKNEAKRVADTIRLGQHQGKTNYDLLKMVRGTKANNYQDGILSISKRNAVSIVRTSTAVYANEAKAVFARENDDLIDAIQIVATLDQRTSTLCRNLDGEIMPLKEAIYPPYHFNCRTTFIYVLKEGFIKPKYRASMNGTVKNMSYYEWLKTQPDDFQDEVLGKARAKLFREGGLTIEQFKALQLDKNFKPMTLEEMRKKEPSIFRDD